MTRSTGLQLSAALFLLPAITSTSGFAQNSYGPGVTDIEIKIGNIMPYSGIFSEFGATGRAEAAYFQMINDAGGVNGRKITFLSLDSRSDFNTSVPLAKQLVEQDQVLLTVGTWGAPTNLKIRAYMNENQVPQLFVADTNSAMNDPVHYPWTMGFQASKKAEGAAYGRYVLQNMPGAKIAILCGSAPSDQEWITGLRAALGEKTDTMIAKMATLNSLTPSALDPEVVALRDSGADVFMDLTLGRFATEAIREAFDIGWRPLQFIPNASLSIAAFLDPAGLHKASGIISNARSKGWLKPEAQRDPAVHAFTEWMAKYNPEASRRDANYVYGYEVAQTLVEVLNKCGNDLTRANVMKQATSLDFELGMLRPGIKITTSPTDYRPIKQLFLIQFDGQDWQSIGPVQAD